MLDSFCVVLKLINIFTVFFREVFFSRRKMMELSNHFRVSPPPGGGGTQHESN